VPRRFAILLLALAALLPVPAAAQDRMLQFTDTLPDSVQKKTVVIERKVGDGAEAEPGKFVVIEYEGFVYDLAKPGRKGARFDSTVERGVPLSVLIGVGRMISGVDRGILGMKVGGERTLVIPPRMGYGDRLAFGELPPNSTLIFEVRLVDVVAERNTK
jgi:FKBP-type peptidyl-prolyl cis-trans isomerase FkpA